MFGPTSSQAEVYNHCVEPLLCRVLSGQNASVFAYGPTGSGMKYTFIFWYFKRNYFSFLCYFEFAYTKHAKKHPPSYDLLLITH